MSLKECGCKPRAIITTVWLEKIRKVVSIRKLETQRPTLVKMVVSRKFQAEKNLVIYVGTLTINLSYWAYWRRFVASG